MKCGNAVNVIKGDKSLQDAVNILIMTIPDFSPEDLATLPDWMYDVLDDDIKTLIHECLYRWVMDVKKSGAKEGRISFADLLQEVCEKLQDKLVQDDELRVGVWSVIFDRMYEDCDTDDEFTERAISLSKLCTWRHEK